MKHLRVRLARHLLTAALAAALPALPAAAASDDPAADRELVSAGFLTGHPDMKYRLMGLQAFKAGKNDDALRYFQRAAYFADKPAQGMVAEMLWKGEGVPQDRALAYAWMDLAAERGYVGFLGLRETYWAALSPAERERAIDEGQALYARYGDAAAQPRIASRLRQQRRSITGSRTGFAGNVKIYFGNGEVGFSQMDGTKFFDDKYWDPKKYQAWTDSIWQQPRIGTVSVGEASALPAGDSAASRIPATRPDHDAAEPATPDDPVPTRP